MQVNFELTIDANDNEWNNGGFGKEMEESVEWIPSNLEKSIWRLDDRMHLRIWKVVTLD